MSADRSGASWLALPLLAALLSDGPAAAQSGIGTVGAEFDDASGYLLFGALGGEWSAATSWDLTVSRSDTTTTLAAFRTTAFAGSGYHDFGPVGLRIGLGGWRDEGLARVERLTGSVDWHRAGWSVALEAELRHSDFDPLTVDRTIIRRDGTPVTINATADCEVDSTGTGLRFSYFNAAWSFSLSGMQYDYDNFGCDFDLQALDRLRSSTRDEFVQLADRVTDVLAIGAGRRLLAETSFLDSRLGLSLRHQGASRAYSVYYDRIEDAFFERSADTLSAGVAFPVRPRTELEVYAGVTDSNTNDRIAFIGLMLTVER